MSELLYNTDHYGLL